jgi:MoxR-like ATPase
MANKSINQSINLSIFAALKVSEVSKIPTLLLANPGTGKSSTVELFSKVRGYELILLRGNSESAETILGYDVAPTDTSKENSTKHLRPEWFQNILNNSAAGKKTLLFLDEITTATEYVQAALLHLIFERKVGAERIPDDTLIVSAGNYASNLSNSMIMLPPLMNRFMIYNIVPGASDLDTFLNKYDGSISGKRINYFEECRKQMEAIDQQEMVLTQSQEDKIGEYIERYIKMVAKQLMTAGEKPVDLAVSDLQNIYSDLEKDEKLPGFVTLRTLNYLRDVTVASYKCFGKAGIMSDNYKNMVFGLCGLGVSRDSKGEVKKTIVSSDFCNAMANVVNEIEKMNNNKLPQYEEFFNNYIKDDAAKFEVAEMNTIVNKIRELRGDKDLENIERPIDSAMIEKMCKILCKSVSKITKYKIDPTGASDKDIPVESFSGDVNYWNNIATMMTEVQGLVNDPRTNYPGDTKNTIRDTQTELRKASFKLKTLRKIVVKKDAALANTVPEIKSFK